jgi:hypothetical protein
VIERLKDTVIVAVRREIKAVNTIWNFEKLEVKIYSAKRCSSLIN